MRMADFTERVKAWASTVTASLAIAIIVGGFNLHGDVQAMSSELAANVVLAQAVDRRANLAESNAASVKTELEGLRRDIDKVGAAVEKQAAEANQDRALILQELGRLQGRSDSPRR